jgi:hypothetical protein
MGKKSTGMARQQSVELRKIIAYQDPVDSPPPRIVVPSPSGSLSPQLNT